MTIVNVYFSIDYYSCARRVQLCVWIALTNILFIDESMAVQFFLNLLYGIINGFDITLDLLLMVWNFKDILRFV